MKKLLFLVVLCMVVGAQAGPGAAAATLPAPVAMPAVAPVLAPIVVPVAPAAIVTRIIEALEKAMVQNIADHTGIDPTKYDLLNRFESVVKRKGLIYQHNQAMGALHVRLKEVKEGLESGKIKSGKEKTITDDLVLDLNTTIDTFFKQHSILVPAIKEITPQ